jgi:hypothetical protein
MSGECGGQGIGTVCGNFVESGWLILSQKAMPHNAHVPVQSPFHKQLTEKRKDGCRAICWRKKTSRVSLWSARNLISVAQLDCAPKNFQNSEGTLWTHCMYWEHRGRIFISLNESQHESLFFRPIIILTTLFWILKSYILYGELPQKIIPYVMMECM